MLFPFSRCGLNASYQNLVDEFTSDPSSCSQVVLASDASILIVDAQEAVSPSLSLGKIILMATSPNGDFMAAFVEDGPLIVLAAGLQQLVSFIST